VGRLRTAEQSGRNAALHGFRLQVLHKQPVRGTQQEGLKLPRRNI
jgi:hypothetical protein